MNTSDGRHNPYMNKEQEQEENSSAYKETTMANLDTYFIHKNHLIRNANSNNKERREDLQY